MLLEPVPFIHEAIWEAHVQQLKACPNCGRTFFPDRIKVSMSLALELQCVPGESGLS